MFEVVEGSYTAAWGGGVMPGVQAYDWVPPNKAPLKLLPDMTALLWPEVAMPYPKYPVPPLDLKTLFRIVAPCVR